MRLITYYHQDKDREQLALLVDGKAYDTNALDKRLPDNMTEFLWGEEEMMIMAKAFDVKIKAGDKVRAKPIDAEKLMLLSPLTQPVSFRNVVGFRSLFEQEYGGKERQKLEAYDTYLPFSFGNHNSIQGNGPVNCMQEHLKELDFGVGLAAVIGLGGYNIRLEEAEEYIAGFMVMNQFCSRSWRNVEQKMAWGRGKSVDFATVMGPCLVTPDELKSYICNEEAGNTNYEWKAKYKVNGEVIAKSQSQMDWTFAEIVTYSAYGTELYPGEVIGVGQLNLGSLAAINAKEKTNHRLKEGDIVEVDVEGLGTLGNKVVRNEDDYKLFE